MKKLLTTRNDCLEPTLHDTEIQLLMDQSFINLHEKAQSNNSLRVENKRLQRK